MIRNWKAFLESNESDLDIIKEILSELEDDFNIILDYDLSDKHFFCVIGVGTPSNGKNNEMVKILNSLCDKIHSLTNDKYFCEFKLSFTKKRQELDDKQITIISDLNNNINYQEYPIFTNNSLSGSTGTRIFSTMKRLDPKKFRSWSPEIKNLDTYNYKYGYVWVNEKKND